ncbi:hypothetical protein AB431_15800 [Mycobacterium sp. EPa45]|nr:hypothetical protein AB431_15800 [Mycobacterium sp. EPa45]
MGRRRYAHKLGILRFLTQRSVIDSVDILAAHVVLSYASLRPRDLQSFADLTARFDRAAGVDAIRGEPPADAGESR